MNRLRLIPTALALALVLAVPAAAQNSSTEPAGAGTAANPPKTEPAPPATTAPSATTPVPVTVAPAQPVIVTPPVQTVPQQPVTIQPDVAYPNGFADPADPFANDLALSYRQREGFPWGLLGLLGLLGLIPLIRGNGRVRTVYVERDEEPRRVVRRDRIEEE
jgi:hypothetical protein